MRKRLLIKYDEISIQISLHAFKDVFKTCPKFIANISQKGLILLASYRDVAKVVTQISGFSVIYDDLESSDGLIRESDFQ